VSYGPSSVLHAYGVVRAGVPVWLPSRGLGDAPVHLVTVDRLAAVVSPLEATAFGTEAWQEHAEDPAWLGEAAAGHQAVLSTVITSTDVLPFRLPGIYADEESLRAVLTQEADLLERGLTATTNHVEWGVQVFRVMDTEAPEVPRPRTGRGYLDQLSARSRKREDEAAERQQLVLEAYGLLADASSHSVTNAPQDPALSGRDEPMLLNSAHLVPRGAEDGFFAVVDQVQRQLAGGGLRIEVSGPWPPYNFVHLATEELRGTP
jgi:hypothetical protein